MSDYSINFYSVHTCKNFIIINVKIKAIDRQTRKVKRLMWSIIYFANPCDTQIHPTCIPVSGDYQSKLTLMSESLRNDGRIWVPKKQNDPRKPKDIPEDERDYYLERRYPAFGNLVPRDVASRAAKERCDAGYGVGTSKQAVYLDFADAIQRYGHVEVHKQRVENATAVQIRDFGKEVVKQKYGNLFNMYEKITGENPYEVPMRIYPAIHYTMGGLWVDYELMTSIRGLYCLGEANFSDHGANRLGASALMQGLSDGYFILPYTITNYLGTHSQELLKKVETSHPAFEQAEKQVRDEIGRLIANGKKGKRTPNDIFKELGLVTWEHVGMARDEKGLKLAIEKIAKLQNEYDNNMLLNDDSHLNTALQTAQRLGDYLELARLMAQDALHRTESCGGHFRVESQSPEGEAQRDDANFAYAAAWEYKGKGQDAILHKEPLVFENVKPSTRSYK